MYSKTHCKNRIVNHMLRLKQQKEAKAAEEKAVKEAAEQVTM